MKRHLLLPLLLVTIASAADVRAADYDTRELNWNDAARHRPVPVKFYIPKNLAGPTPIVLFSHGLGGSRKGYAYLGQYWAEHGYIAVHLQHVGSDDSLWRSAPVGERMNRMKAAANPREFIQRAKDVKFAIDQLTRLNGAAGDPLAGKLDLARIAMAGHSFGGQTTEAISGEIFALPGGDRTLGDPRIKCAIVMSPAAPENPTERDKAFSKIAMPVFDLTGTEDDSPIGNVRAKDRRIPYDKTAAADQYLLTFKDTDHMLFSGAWSMAPGKQRLYDEDHPIIQEATTKFLDAYLKNDPAAKAWMHNDLKKLLGDRGTLEWK